MSAQRKRQFPVVKQQPGAVVRKIAGAGPRQSHLGGCDSQLREAGLSRWHDKVQGGLLRTMDRAPEGVVGTSAAGKGRFTIYQYRTGSCMSLYVQKKHANNLGENTDYFAPFQDAHGKECV